MTTAAQLRRQVRDRELGRPVNVAGSTVAPGLVIGFALCSMLALAGAMTRYSYDVWAAFWVAPVLVFICMPIASAAGRAEGDSGVGRFLLYAAFVKVVVGPILRFAVLDVAYEGGGDSEAYHRVGTQLAPLFRQLEFADLGKISGTRFIEVVTGIVYAVIGVSELGGFLVFSFLSYLGMYWMYRAFVIAHPRGDRVRFRWLLFAFPTMWFWPSSIGKDAWMLCTIGLALYGLASLSVGRLRGLPLAALGIWGCIAVRPHIASLLVVSAAIGAIVLFAGRGEATEDDRPSPLRRRIWVGVLLVVVAVGAIGAVAQVQATFELDELDVESAESVLDEASRRTAQGGSQFAAPSPGSPVGYAKAAATVLFRPFPIEAPNAQALASSVEGVALALLVWFSLPRLGRLGSSIVRRPLTAVAMVYVLGFIYAFSTIENFGILARQRAQVLPFLFVLLAGLAPTARRTADPDTDTDPGAATATDADTAERSAGSTGPGTGR